MTVYRIVQECITNMLKHAGASRVSIVLSVEEDVALLTVEDDGRGFDVEKALLLPADARGMGLAVMAERARVLGGRLDIKSSEGQGTRIRLTFPIAREGEAG